jgi:7-cyano-7-deazaguanine synthase
MDSLALAWWKRPDVAFTVDYGQRAAQAEIAASSAICNAVGIAHQVLAVDCRSLGSGDMSGAEAPPIAPTTDWWPYRNQLLVTLTAMRAVALGVQRLLIGTVSSDSSHLDGTTEFVSLINRLVRYQEGNLSIEAPAIDMSTADLIARSGVPAHVLAWAHSCHKSNTPCGDCRGCNKYLETYEQVGYDLERLGRPAA